jgi:hypothetical protein
VKVFDLAFKKFFNVDKTATQHFGAYTVIVLEMIFDSFVREAGFGPLAPGELALVPGMMSSHMILLIKNIHGLMTVIKWTSKGLVLSTRMSDKLVPSMESKSVVDAGLDRAEESALLGVFGVDMTFEVRLSRKRLRDFATRIRAPVTSDKMGFEMLFVRR